LQASGCHPVAVSELTVSPASPPLERLVEAVAGAVKAGDDRRRERVDLAERVADPASGGGVLVMAASPPAPTPGRTRRGKNPVQRTAPSTFAYPLSALQRGRHGSHWVTYRNETALDVAAEALKLAQLWHREG